MRLSVIVAAAENGAIGLGGDLPWRLSADLRRFKQLTMGHCLIMGRKTYDSIGRPLPGRVSIVLSRASKQVADNNADDPEPVHYVDSLEKALRLAPTTSMQRDEAFVIGGAEVYRLALPLADRIYFTRVHAHVEGDAFLPEIQWDDWRQVSTEPLTTATDAQYASTLGIYDRNRAS